MVLVLGFTPDGCRAPVGASEGEGELLRLRLKGEERKRAAKEGRAAFCLRLNETLRLDQLTAGSHSARLPYPPSRLPFSFNGSSSARSSSRCISKSPSERSSSSADALSGLRLDVACPFWFDAELDMGHQVEWRVNIAYRR